MKFYIEHFYFLNCLHNLLIREVALNSKMLLTLTAHVRELQYTAFDLL